MPSANLRAKRALAISGLAWMAIGSLCVSAAWAQTVTRPTVPPPSTERRLPDGTILQEGEPFPEEQAPGAAGVPSGGAPAPVPLRGITFGASAEASELYTSNAFGYASSLNVPDSADFITRVQLNLNAHARSLRFVGDLSYSLVGDYFARHPSLNALTNYLNAIGQAVLVPEHVTLFARAFASPTFTSRLGPLGAINRPVASGAGTGLINTYGYMISPDLTFRFGDFATSETTFSYGSIYFDYPVDRTIPSGLGDAPDTTTYGLMQRFVNGINFQRLNWTITGTANKTTRPGSDLEEAGGILDLRYGLTREVALLATGGYESISTTQQLNQSVTGEIALAGLQLNLGPGFQASARAGRQFQQTSYLADMRVALGPFTTIIGSLTDGVGTPAQQLLSGLGRLGANAQGQFYDTSYQLTQNLNQANVPSIFQYTPGLNTQIDNSISRFRTGSLSLIYQAERTQYRLTGRRVIRDNLTAQAPTFAREEWNSGELAVSRNLTPATVGTISATYTESDIYGGEYSILQGNAQLNYAVSPATQLYLMAAYIHRLSDAALVAATSVYAGNLTDETLAIGIRHQF